MSDPTVDALLTRLPFERRFDGVEAFDAIRTAEQWLRDHDYCFGPTQIGAPVAVFHGDGIVSKWFNLSCEERMSVDGLILRGRDSFRADVVVRLARDPDTDPAGLTAVDVQDMRGVATGPGTDGAGDGR